MVFRIISKGIADNSKRIYSDRIVPKLGRRMYEIKSTGNLDPQKKCEEIRIEVPWGHIAGKWWGSKAVRPIIGLHGWQDNAGTFDTLAPLLPPHISLLALDLPGHGLSSRIPHGMFYHSTDFLYLLVLIANQYKWEKLSLMAHSMGSICCFVFAAIFPNKVDMVIGLDALKPHIRPLKGVPESMARRIESFTIADQRNREELEPPSYTYEEAVEKLHIGTFKSIDENCCSYLLNRNLQRSRTDSNKYYFTRDSRLKSYNYGYTSQELNLDLAERITAPYLFIKASDSPYYEEIKYFHEAIDVMKKKENFEFHQVEGTHHVHLNEPHKIAPIINDFINKYRSAEQISKL